MPVIDIATLSPVGEFGSKAWGEACAAAAVTILEAAELPSEIENFVRDNQVIPEEIFVEADEIARIARLIGEYDYTPPPAKPSKKAEKDKTGDSDKKVADRVVDKDAQIEFYGGEELPLPKPVVVKTRVWRPIRMVVKSLNAHG